MTEVFNLTTAHKIERDIVRAIIKQAFAEGFTLGVEDGEDITLSNSADQTAVEEALCTTDEDLLIFYRDGKSVGWVKLIYGNREDVISDYTTNLEDVLKPANKLAEEYS